ncbi:transcriptional regulator [Kitasatospora xanthocidica]|uniref:transcriptional regulator n=1 Tax=Kitasatospora xanthocidica TaxID=83382 RepID=UPI001E2F5A89|nr:transcriptional regulator [Kitasatospora xanthocidica]
MQLTAAGSTMTARVEDALSGVRMESVIRSGGRTAVVRMSTLSLGESPRTEGVDGEHVARLASVEDRLPPILVRRSDLVVIDGMHRLQAARARGDQTIEVEFFDGSDGDAFLRAVEANVAHGLPLSLKDRRAAAARIIASHPQMSDRAVARASGLGAKAVARIRAARSTAAPPQLDRRVGRDGRVRPLNAAEGRWRAAGVLAENPEASLREIARLAGISPATASDVRRRVRAGLPPADSGGDGPATTPPPEEAGARTDPQGRPPAGTARPDCHRAERPAAPHPDLLLAALRRDPSLRLREEGRGLLRLLQHNATAEWSGLSSAVPAHCESMVGRLARQYAEQWLRFAEHLEEREEPARRDPAG